MVSFSCSDAASVLKNIAYVHLIRAAQGATF
jgi:hypothetical protein